MATMIYYPYCIPGILPAYRYVRKNTIEHFGTFLDCIEEDPGSLHQTTGTWLQPGTYRYSLWIVVEAILKCSPVSRAILTPTIFSRSLALMCTITLATDLCKKDNLFWSPFVLPFFRARSFIVLPADKTCASLVLLV